MFSYVKLKITQVETAVAQATTLTETDVGRETCHVITSTMVENIKGSPQGTEAQKTPIEFWDTSVGRFRFTLDDLPPQLRLINSILTVAISKIFFTKLFFVNFLRGIEIFYSFIL